LFRNDGGNANRWIQVRLKGKPGSGNRSAIGAEVRIGAQWRTVHSGSSYCSQSDLTLTFGLGTDSRPVTVEVVWPGGATSKHPGLQPGRRYMIDEGGAAAPAP
jgi:hypothetical protein